MARRTLRYALIDLTNRTAAIQEASADHFGTWAVYTEELAFWWEIDPAAVALTAGILTGVGAPGTGAMGWSCPARDGRLKTGFGEGRAGAMLRCSGADALILVGHSSRPVCLTAGEGGIAVEEQPASRRDLQTCRAHGDDVLVTVGAGAIVEDRQFAIGGSAAARALRAKGVASMVISAEGAFPIADSAAVTALSVELYQAAIASGRLRGRDGRETLAPYLSLDQRVTCGEKPSYKDPARGPEARLLAALGMVWSEALSGRDALADAAALIEAASGLPCTAAELRELGEYLAAREENRATGGAAQWHRELTS